MPLIGIRNELLQQTVQIIPVPGLPIKTVWSLIWLKGKKHSPISASFLDYLKQNKASIVQQKFSWSEEY
jgi:DNA-binding transcriptional LysR family regulator